MICRECLAETQVVETRDEGLIVKRRRMCPTGHRFSTEELSREDLNGLRHAAQQLADLRALLAVVPAHDDANESRPADL